MSNRHRVIKPSTREILEKIYSYLHSQITYYRFNKNVLKVSDKYRDGRLAALQYASELSLYYMHLEQSIKDQYKEQILQQRKPMVVLKTETTKRDCMTESTTPTQGYGV